MTSFRERTISSLAYAPKADPAGLIEKLGERYEVTRTNIKKWTVGSPIQAPLDALEIMLKKHPFSADQVQQVIVRIGHQRGVHREQSRNARHLPPAHGRGDADRQDRLVRGGARQAAHAGPGHPPRSAPRCSSSPTRSSSAACRARVAIVEVTLTDGTKLTERVDAVRGTVENPMTREEVVAKCRDLMAPVLGATTCNTLIEKVLGLENVKNIRELRPLLQRG